VGGSSAAALDCITPVRRSFPFVIRLKTGFACQFRLCGYPLEIASKRGLIGDQSVSTALVPDVLLAPTPAICFGQVFG
jgi:hypothetical protein